MNYNKFIGKCIIALLSCIIGLTSCGNDNKNPTNDIHYTTIDNSVLPIKDLFYFGEERIVSNSYDSVKNVCILKFDKDVTEIWDLAFWGCSSLTSITIPPSVKKIGKNAFSGCSNLTSITIPPSVTEIGNDAFRGCSSLTSISIPPSVTKIGDRAFRYCTSLMSIIIPPSVREIGGVAFADCSSLTSIIVSKDNKVYDSREDCNAIIHTESNTLISGCKNTIIPPSVREIGNCAFYGCDSLTSISIPPSVTKIGDGEFSDCPNLTEIRIPKGCNVTEQAFKYSPKVKIIRY